jgi:XTP/dITP diphosphohydrolase
MPRSLVLASSNPGKWREFHAFFQAHAPRWELRPLPAAIEVEESGSTFVENALLKAKAVATALGEWAIADDSGLAVAALGGAPGVHSARYAPDDAARIQRLLREMEGISNRQATFHCAIAVVDPPGPGAGTGRGSLPRGNLDPAPGRGGVWLRPALLGARGGADFC